MTELQRDPDDQIQRRGFNLRDESLGRASPAPAAAMTRADDQRATMQVAMALPGGRRLGAGGCRRRTGRASRAPRRRGREAGADARGAAVGNRPRRRSARSPAATPSAAPKNTHQRNCHRDQQRRVRGEQYSGTAARLRRAERRRAAPGRASSESAADRRTAMPPRLRATRYRNVPTGRGGTWYQ